MKKSILLCVCLLLMSSVSALGVQVDDYGSVVIAELNNPARYQITFDSAGDTIELYSLVGATFSPRGSFDILAGRQIIPVDVYTSSSIRKRDGIFAFEYFITSRAEGSLTKQLQLRVALLKDTLEIIPIQVHYLDDHATIVIKNNQNARLDNVTASITSPFFTKQVFVSLTPYGNTSIDVPIDTHQAAKLSAGSYVVKAVFTNGDSSGSIEGILQYLEQQGTSISEQRSGWLIREHTVTKTNAGNVPVQDTITIKRTVLARLFTNAAPDADDVVRSGLSVSYVWKHPLQPGASWTAQTVTNYTLPFLVLLLIVVVAFLVHLYTSTAVIVTKQVSYVKTKGGQFALKVRLAVRAKHHVDSVQVIDRLPGMAKLYEKFGIRPDRIDTMTRRLIWDVPSLQAGEERVFSYILYADVNPVGRFELPAATAVFDYNGKTHEAVSNRAFFLSETAKIE